MVTQRARDTAALVASIGVCKAEAAAVLEQRFATALRADETMPDYLLALELAGRSVQSAFDRLDELDDRHQQAKAERGGQAREVDRVAKRELYPQAVDVRRQIDAAFGREAGADLHTFTGRTPRTPSRLREHAERAVSRLGDPRRELPALLPGAGEPVDREIWKQRLEGPLGELIAADERLGRLQSELNAISGRRQQAMERFDAVYAESLRFVEATLAMAGLQGQRLKSLRPRYLRRRLALWARKKREARARRSAPSTAGATPARDPGSRPGVLAALSKWLKQRRVFG